MEEDHAMIFIHNFFFLIISNSFLKVTSLKTVFGFITHLSLVRPSPKHTPESSLGVLNPSESCGRPSTRMGTLEGLDFSYISFWKKSLFNVFLKISLSYLLLISFLLEPKSLPITENGKNKK